MLCAVGLVLSGHDAVASAAEPSQQGRINVTMPHRCRGRLSGGWPPRSHIGYPTKSFEAPFLDSSAFPRLSVAGLPKAGSSTLYQLLASHPNLRSAYPEKEHCDFALSWSAAIHAMQVFKARQHEQTRSKRLLNSCICLHCVVCHLTFLNAVSRSPRSLPIQYVVAVREPADRAWATYNYWWMGSDFLDHDPHGHPHHGGWVTRDAHNRSVRSPELFHELVLAGDLIRGNEMGVRRWRRPVFSEMDPWLPLGLLLRLREQAGEANLLLLDTDALGSADTLRRIARFASLDEEPLLSSRYAGMRINAGAPFLPIPSGGLLTANAHSSSGRHGPGAARHGPGKPWYSGYVRGL
jgi:hypothetical protein